MIVGQDRAIERMLVCLLARGHCLLESVPGLAKTLSVETLAQTVGGTFARVQFTPDLLPADVIGTRIYRGSSGDVRRRARADLRQLPARRRDQPGPGQGAVRAARGDGRAPGHHRRHDPPGPRAVPGDGDAEPDRVRGRLPAPRGPARPVPHEGRPRLPEPPRGDRDRPADGRRGARGGQVVARGAARLQQRPTRCPSTSR